MLSRRGRLWFTALAAAVAAVASLSATDVLAESGASTVAKRPPIVWKPIPFSATRRQEMAAYSKRHYGIESWRLGKPEVVVQHYTVSTTFSSAYWTFASDAPDNELHELPGICAHFVIDTDGTIYQLVPLSTMCRHTVGLNHHSVGIEHVGMSDRGVLDNRRQMRASLALTAWLMGRYGIQLGDVIGHTSRSRARTGRSSTRPGAVRRTATSHGRPWTSIEVDWRGPPRQRA